MDLRVFFGGGKNNRNQEIRKIRRRDPEIKNRKKDQEIWNEKWKRSEIKKSV